MTIAAVVWPLHMPFAGVTQPQEAGFNLAFEKRLQALAQAAMFTQHHPQLRDMERTILTRHVLLAHCQIAHFWYLAGEAFMAHSRWRAAYEAIELCLRVLDPTNDLAMAQVHTLRYRIAFQRQHFQAAQASCQIVLTSLHQIPHTNACSLPLFDQQGLLAAARAMSLRVRYLMED